MGCVELRGGAVGFLATTFLSQRHRLRSGYPCVTSNLAIPIRMLFLTAFSLRRKIYVSATHVKFRTHDMLLTCHDRKPVELCKIAVSYRTRLLLPPSSCLLTEPHPRALDIPYLSLPSPSICAVSTLPFHCSFFTLLSRVTL